MRIYDMQHVKIMGDVESSIEEDLHIPYSVLCYDVFTVMHFEK